MKAKITFFPVGNGDMTLISLADLNKTTLLIDTNIRQAADDHANDSFPDVARELRERIKYDSQGRPRVDVFLLTHPDKDHCTGLNKHFYFGSQNDYPDDNKPEMEKRIIINEIWSSPMVFRRASKNHTLCEDAKSFNREVRRRVNVNTKNFFNVQDGDRILILGEDINDKTSDLMPIVIKTGEVFSRVNGKNTTFLECTLLAPSIKQEDDLEELLSKNHSSVILNFKIAASEYEPDACRFLAGGDAEVAIWELVYDKYKNNSEALKYDLLLTPHHCSWHSLSYDSWSEKGEDAKVSPDARQALAQTREGASIVSSSKEVLDDDNDPPCIRAKREYQNITNNSGGLFYCTGNQKYPLEFEVDKDGISLIRNQRSSAAIIVSSPAPRAG